MRRNGNVRLRTITVPYLYVYWLTMEPELHGLISHAVRSPLEQARGRSSGERSLPRLLCHTWVVCSTMELELSWSDLEFGEVSPGANDGSE